MGGTCGERTIDTTGTNTIEVNAENKTVRKGDVLVSLETVQEWNYFDFDPAAEPGRDCGRARHPELLLCAGWSFLVGPT